MPSTIPTHFNSEGVIDGYSDKSSIWMLPLVVSVLYIGMTILNMFPHIFNYTTTITDDNALRQYTITIKMIRYVKSILTIIFGYIIFKTIQISIGESSGGLGHYFTPLMLSLVFLPLIYYFYALIKKRDS